MYKKLGTYLKCATWWVWGNYTNGTSLQSSWLENPTDGGAWWAAVHDVAKSWTRLSNFTFFFTFMHWRRKWQPTPVFLPGESQGRGSLVGCHLRGRTESDTTEVTLQQQHSLLRASLLAQMVKNLPAMWETWLQTLGWEDPLEEGMATLSSILVWRTPIDRGAQRASVHGIERVRRDWATKPKHKPYWNHNHCLSHRYNHHLPKLSPTPLLLWPLFCVSVVRTLKIYLP